MPELYYVKDADMSVLEGKTIAIIGYGIQGRGQALNLKDNGLNVVVGARKGRRTWAQAEEDGLTVLETPEAARQADLIQILTQDHLQPSVYESQIAAHLEDGNALVFSHGFNIHFKQIVPPPNVDVIMVAPKGPGSLVRTMYLEGKATPALLAVYQDYTGQAKALGLAYANGIGCLSAGVFETTFREETETDLFGEQSVLCGGVSELVRAGFDTLVEAGYAPEIAYFECLHELKLIVDMINDGGVVGMRKRVSDTAKYGDLTRGRRVVNDSVRQEMRKILGEIQSGEFAREWILENQANRPVFNARMEQDADHLIEKVGSKLRALMPWMDEYKG